MHEILRALGKDSSCSWRPTSSRCRYEYRFFASTGSSAQPPPDVAERTVVFLDCGNIDRNPAEALQLDDAHIVNLDHHHDNTHFGTVNHVVPEASCTAEIVWDLMHGLGVTPTREDRRGAVRRARHRHRQVHVREHRHARARDGGRADRGGRRRARRLPPHLRGRPVREGRAAGARARADRAPRRRAARRSRASRARTSRACGAEENYSEGVVDHLRAIEGTAVAALVRDRLGAPDPEQRKVSLRASDDRVDVSAIARAQGGGGHRQAAGFSTTLPWDELVAFLRDQVAAQLDARAPQARRLALRCAFHSRWMASTFLSEETGTSPQPHAAVAQPRFASRLGARGARRPPASAERSAAPRASMRRRHPVRQARRRDLARRRRPDPPAAGQAARRSATPARSTRSPPACCSSSSAARRGSSAS